MGSNAASCSDSRCATKIWNCNPNPSFYCCGDGTCNGEETLGNCEIDGCTCGNYKCEPELGETVSTCEHDCGCNRNFICESHENYEHCPEDCTEDTSEDLSDASADEEMEEEVSDSL